MARRAQWRAIDIDSANGYQPANRRRGVGKETVFWVLNAGGWALLCLVNIYIDRITRIHSPRDVGWALLFYGSAALISAGLRLLYRQARCRLWTIWWLALMAVPASIAAAMLWHVSRAGLVSWLFPKTFATRGGWPGSFALPGYPASVLSLAWPFMMWSLLYFVINFWLEWRRERERAMKATLLAQRAQLQMLRYQLNPHFLFNALNSIRALVDENRENARAMITELAEFLRYSLVHRDYANVTLASEMEAVRLYLSIQKRRYEDKLEVSTEVASAAASYPVPCFLVHPLVENAVKYGMQTSSMPLRVCIKADAGDGILRLSVSNTGRWIAPGAPGAPGAASSDGTGTGLENVRQRLSVAFPDRHRFAVGERDGWVVAELEIRGADDDRGGPQADRPVRERHDEGR